MATYVVRNRDGRLMHATNVGWLGVLAQRHGLSISPRWNGRGAYDVVVHEGKDSSVLHPFYQAVDKTFDGMYVLEQPRVADSWDDDVARHNAQFKSKKTA